ncbi:hypothetical protein HaLaN_15173 [Haematococcus lacustris]|uniref:Uncharacterized protein n=1 Tax=Haematococcus lacustris TaxID=44745 RepID=A0A699ZI01_HAELA|nr:hypothetical protein HaLaN_15173 [Haematococcus lacustris]
MKGKKRKGADGPKQPNPKQPKPKPKEKPDTLGWVGPVSPQGKALKERLDERANSRIQFVKCYLKGFIRGRNKVKNKIVGHFRLMVGLSHKKRQLASLAVLVQLAKHSDPDNAAIIAKLVELDKTELAGDSNTIGALAKQLAVNTQEMFANPERYVKLWAKAARSKYGITLEVSKLVVRVVCQYGLNSSSSELRDTPLEGPEWQERMAFHRHVLTGVLEDVEEAGAPGDPADSKEPEDPDAPPAITKLPLHRRILYAIYLEEEAASVSQQEWGTRKQLVVFFGNAGIGTRGGWGAKAVLQACRKVVERANSGKPTDRVPGKVVTVDEFRTSRVSSILNSPQPCEEELDSSKPTRPEDWKPKPGQGKEYPALGFKKLRDRAPKAQAQQPVAQ